MRQYLHNYLVMGSAKVHPTALYSYVVLTWLPMGIFAFGAVHKLCHTEGGRGYQPVGRRIHQYMTGGRGGS